MHQTLLTCQVTNCIFKDQYHDNPIDSILNIYEATLLIHVKVIRTYVNFDEYALLFLSMCYFISEKILISVYRVICI